MMSKRKRDGKNSGDNEVQSVAQDKAVKRKESMKSFISNLLDEENDFHLE